MCTENLVCFVGFRGLGGLTRFWGFVAGGGKQVCRCAALCSGLRQNGSVCYAVSMAGSETLPFQLGRHVEE